MSKDVAMQGSKSAKLQGRDSLPGAGPVLLISGLLLILTLTGSGWIYLQGANSLQALALRGGMRAQVVASTMFQRVNQWALLQVGATAAGGGCLALVGWVGLDWYRRRLGQRISIRSKAWVEDARNLAETTEVLDGERKRVWKLEEELRKAKEEQDRKVEERTNTLSKTCATLQEELNGRKQAERMMTQQANELVRSKDVLEMHVQVRTQELQKLQRQYESILNSAGEGIYGLDLKGRTTFVNPAAAKLTGRRVEDMVGKYEHEVFIHAEGASEDGSPAKDAEGLHLTEQNFYRDDGSSFMVEYMRTTLKEKNQLTGAVVIFKDITERKRAEEALNRKAAELARSNSELEQFAYVASHDLQEPLRKIQAFGDRLKTKCDAVDLKDGRDYLERMQNAAARMQTLINDLLTFSRVISNTQPFAPVELGVVTKEVLSDLEVRIEKTKARVEVGELPTIDADATQMRQLLQNLIGNALKFCRADVVPEVKIRARVVKNPLGSDNSALPEAVCELVVEDNGIGFEDKFADKIFAVFQRLHGRTEYEGTGVGLAVCRRIADRHGGTIAAKGELGKGATFTVTLPMRHAKKEETSE